MNLGFHWRLAWWNILLALVAFVVFGVRAETFVFAVLALVWTGVTTFRIRKQVMVPLAELSDAVGRASTGSDILPSIRRGAREVQDLSGRVGEWSERVRARLREVSDARIRLQSILDGMVEGVVLFDADRRIILSNAGVLGLLETPRDVLGKTCLEIFRNESLDAAVLRTLEGEHTDVQLQTASGREVQVLLSPIAGENESGIEAVVAVFHDLTAIHYADRIRRDFVANVSHEFKTPLTSIRGYAETLSAEVSETSRKEFAEIIHRNARYLESLVNDLLALARIEAEPPSSCDCFDLRSAIREQVTMHSRLPNADGIRIEVDCPGIEVRADRARLGTALGNLIENAIRYNRPEGTVRISARLDGARVLISVADSGFGIPEDALPRIFERFYRVDRSRTRNGGGTGLGLAIARHAVESQGGVLTAQSRVGSGSTFTIRIPVVQAARTTSEPGS